MLVNTALQLGPAIQQTPGGTLLGGKVQILLHHADLAVDHRSIVNVPVTASGEMIREVAAHGVEAQALRLAAVNGPKVGSTAKAGATIIEAELRKSRTAGAQGRVLGTTGAGRDSKNLCAEADTKGKT